MRHTRDGRAALLGVVLTLVAGAGTSWLATATAQGWPGTGVVATDTALSAVALAGATVAAGWTTVVLGLASITVLRTNTSTSTGQARSAPPASGALPRPVRWTCAALVALAGSTSLPALAEPPAVVSVEVARVGSGTTQGAADSAPVAVGTTPVAADSAPVAVGTAQVAAETARAASMPARVAAETARVASGTVPIASSTHARPATPADSTDGAVPQPGWTPTPTTSAPVAPDGVGLVSTLPHESLPDEVVVRRGDTLWDIAARHLGPGASIADIAEEWPRWYAANAVVVGPNPDLITPGLQLVAPGERTDR